MVEDFTVKQHIYGYYDICICSEVGILSTFDDGSWVSKKYGEANSDERTVTEPSSCWLHPVKLGKFSYTELNYTGCIDAILHNKLREYMEE